MNTIVVENSCEHIMQEKDSPSLVSTTWHLKRGVHLRLFHIQQLPAEITYTGAFRFILEEESSLLYVPIMLGARTSTLRVYVQLATGAYAHIAGSYSLSENQTTTIETYQHHTHAHSSSICTMNGIVAGAAAITYQGTIRLEKQAHYSSAQQENKTILMGKQARAHSTPSLEICAHNVHCKHGSAAGPLSPEHVWYMQSRGLHRTHAYQVLTESFFSTVLSCLPDGLKENIVPLLVQKAIGGIHDSTSQ